MILGVKVGGSKQRRRVNLHAIAEKDQSPAQRSGIEFHTFLDVLRVVSLKENVEGLLLGEKSRNAGHDFLAVHFQRRSSQARAQALSLGLHLGRFFRGH